MKFGTALAQVMLAVAGIQTNILPCNASLVHDHVINRILEASVNAPNWPTSPTSPLCEAYGYIDSAPSAVIKGDSEIGFYQLWKRSYFESLTGGVEDETAGAGPGTYNDGMRKAIHAASAYFKGEGEQSDFDSSESDLKLMEYALATRTHSPLCEMHRSLAQSAISFLFENEIHSDAFAVMAGNDNGNGGIAYATATGINGSVEFKQVLNVAGSSMNDSDAVWAKPLPDEKPLYDNSSKEAVSVAVLYGNFSSPTFAALYKALVDQSISFVVRFMNASGTGSSAQAVGTALQGYGVRVDIKNLEYKSFDDKADAGAKSQDASSTQQDVKVDEKYENLTPEQFKDLFTNGIDPIMLQHPTEGMKGFLKDYLPHLHTDVIQNENGDNKPLKDHIFIPPKSELKDLSMQATTVISQSKDPLWTMQQLSQNLPSFVSELGNVTVPADMSQRVEKVQAMIGMGYGRGMIEDSNMALHVNGRKILVERPSFNVFELINVIREENELLKSLNSLGLGKEAENVVAKFVSMGKDDFDQLSDDDDDEAGMNDPMGMSKSTETQLRFDVGTGYRGAVIYLNDIERDQEYHDWPTNVQQALFQMQYNGQLTIRRNILTILLVLDPLNVGDGFDQTLGMLMQMMQSGMPVRLGIVFATNQDIETCKNNLNVKDDKDVDCLLDGTASSGSNEITTEKIMKVYQNVANTYGTAVKLPYLYLLMNGIKSEMTLHEFVDLHAQSLMRIGVPAQNALSEVMNAIKKEHRPDSKAERYSHAVKFAVTKNIRPGMAFVNGIPLQAGNPQEVHATLTQEMHHIMGMMMTGKITDKSPRSIYAMLLKGKNVRKSMHPLYSEESPEYRMSTVAAGDKSIFKLGEDDDPECPKIVFDIVADLISEESLSSVSSMLTALSVVSDKNRNMNEEEQTSIAFRVVPSDEKSSKSVLGSLFRNANEFGLNDLLGFVKSAQKIAKGTNVNAEIEDFQSDSNIRTAIDQIVDGDQCIKAGVNCIFENITLENKASAVIIANGRLFNPSTLVVADDIEILIDLERGTAKTITERFAPHFFGNRQFAAVYRAASFLGQMFSSEEFTSNQRSDVLGPYKGHSLIKEKLHFKWNDSKVDSSYASRVKVAVVLDPLSDATQRAAPLLRIIRDTLKLPLELVLMPRLVIDNNSALPLTSYYRFVADAVDDLDFNGQDTPKATFEGLPANQILTVRMDVPEPWDIQQSSVVQDTDNLRCDNLSCGDDAYSLSGEGVTAIDLSSQLTKVEYSLNSLLFFGQCYDTSDQTSPNGLQLTLSNTSQNNKGQRGYNVEILPDGSISGLTNQDSTAESVPHAETLVMKTVGYWQLRSGPGIWQLAIAKDTKGAEIYEIVKGRIQNNQIQVNKEEDASSTKTLIMKDFVNRMEVILLRRKKGFENAELLVAPDVNKNNGDDDTVHVFSLATGHLYERFLKIMILSVTKRTSTKVKFWLFENFLSPSFKASAFAMAEEIGCEIEFVTYKWPEWLRGQSEKQRIIWGYKILFLDVLFPLDLKKVIYVDADQVVRGDLKELWDMDLEGAPYGYTPMCESREETKGYQFWREGFWPAHLRGKPYHISALYVVDLQRFRHELVGDQLRAVYQQLTADPNNLSNLDQDLPNYTQHQIKIFSLPQDWLWCESWCSEETKVSAKTIDLCNNPQHKEPKVSMAKRIISGDLFDESWIELDAMVDKYEKQYLLQTQVF